MVSLAYHHLNLSHNPFGELDFYTHQVLTVVDIRPLIALFEQPNHILQIIGKHGRGKTSHLLALAQYYPDIAYTQIHDNQPVTFYQKQSIYQNTVYQKNTAYFIDNLENLAWYKRWAVYHRYQRLAVTTYRDFSKEMRLLGKKVTSYHVSQPDAQQLLTLFNKRIHHAQRNPNLPIPELTLADIKTLQNIFDDNIRSMEQVLYNTFQKMDKQKLEYKDLSNVLMNVLQNNH
ncbi:hypothetical protein [Psychrobacter sp. I-STPA6b]|uniref:hypothetical protein n=1 Tax=Psychrobacter sp. I-STPA6b TaxID=2585718 RepID=UPI001D0C64E0|nr:hypothetical protein [Psychrobacter sp. I-STPA6b]